MAECEDHVDYKKGCLKATAPPIPTIRNRTEIIQDIIAQAEEAAERGEYMPSESQRIHARCLYSSFNDAFSHSGDDGGKYPEDTRWTKGKRRSQTPQAPFNQGWSQWQGLGRSKGHQKGKRSRQGRSSSPPNPNPRAKTPKGRRGGSIARGRSASRPRVPAVVP